MNTAPDNIMGTLCLEIPAVSDVPKFKFMVAMMHSIFACMICNSFSKFCEVSRLLHGTIIKMFPSISPDNEARIAAALTDVSNILSNTAEISETDDNKINGAFQTIESILASCSPSATTDSNIESVNLLYEFIVLMHGSNTPNDDISSVILLWCMSLSRTYKMLIPDMPDDLFDDHIPVISIIVNVLRDSIFTARGNN